MAGADSLLLRPRREAPIHLPPVPLSSCFQLFYQNIDNLLPDKAQAEAFPLAHPLGRFFVGAEQPLGLELGSQVLSCFRPKGFIHSSIQDTAHSAQPWGDQDTVPALKEMTFYRGKEWGNGGALNSSVLRIQMEKQDGSKELPF